MMNFLTTQSPVCDTSNPPSAEGDLLMLIMRDFSRHPEWFDTRPQLIYLSQIRKNMSCWRATRFKLIKAGLENLKEEEMVAILIRPKAGSDYEEGYIIASKKELVNLPQIKKAISTPSFQDKGIYSSPKMPSGLKPFFRTE